MIYCCVLKVYNTLYKLDLMIVKNLEENNYFPTQQKLTDFYNLSILCLLHGRRWVLE